MRKTTFAMAILAGLGVTGLATVASAAPGAPMGVAAPESVTQVRHMHGMGHHHHGMHHRMMHRRHMMRHRMMKRRMRGM